MNISVEQVTVFLNNYRKRYAKFVPNPSWPGWPKASHALSESERHTPLPVTSGLHEERDSEGA